MDREHRELRVLLTDRSKLIAEKASACNRYQKILETANNKLATVVADIQGKRAQFLMNEPLENRTLTPERIGELQKQKKIAPQLKAAPEELSAALDGALIDMTRFTLLKTQEKIDYLAEKIGR